MVLMSRRLRENVCARAFSRERVLCKSWKRSTSYFVAFDILSVSACCVLPPLSNGVFCCLRLKRLSEPSTYNSLF